MKTYLTKHEADFLWNHLKDLNNQSCQIILKKFEKYNVSPDLPLRIFVQGLGTFTSVKADRNKTVQEVLQDNFSNAFEGDALRAQFSRT